MMIFKRFLFTFIRAFFSIYKQKGFANKPLYGRSGPKKAERLGARPFSTNNSVSPNSSSSRCNIFLINWIEQ